jgi:hypothetical protein
MAESCVSGRYIRDRLYIHECRKESSDSCISVMADSSASGGYISDRRFYNYRCIFVKNREAIVYQ